MPAPGAGLAQAGGAAGRRSVPGELPGGHAARKITPLIAGEDEHASTRVLAVADPDLAGRSAGRLQAGAGDRAVRAPDPADVVCIGGECRMAVPGAHGAIALCRVPASLAPPAVPDLY